MITDYAGSTRVATVEPDWEVTPDSTTSFEILQTDLAGHNLSQPVHPTSLPSQVDVANLALIKLGDVQITTFDDDSAHARVVKLLYPRVVDACPPRSPLAVRRPAGHARGLAGRRHGGTRDASRCRPTRTASASSA